MNIARTAGPRNEIRNKLHERYVIREFDNTEVWAGNMQVECGGETMRGHITRLYIDTSPGGARLTVKISIELYIRGITDSASLRDEDIDAVMWTDADRLGFLDEDGMYKPDPGRDFEMELLRDQAGNVVRRGNNAVFITQPIEITRTGAFSCTIRFSADDKTNGDKRKAWVYANDIAHNRDRVLLAIPRAVKDGPSFMEVCVRKYGARIDNGAFVSGKIKNVTGDLESIPADVLYLLPIFEPGTGDILTGEDVRKGDLGSVYAVKNFFRLDPQTATPPEEADIAALAGKGLVSDDDIAELLNEEQRKRVTRAADLARFSGGAEFSEFAGKCAATEIVARAELRELTAKAHALGKKVIFDLVIMTTSRDSQLIIDHREWYALDETGAPKRHKIAWLDYSDVALFDLKHNYPLQNYLGSVAPYWIGRCGLDGVRIDASQTVHASFLKQVKNRICMVKPDALVLGETLCAFDEAIHVPADIIYSLLVDHHVNVNDAQPYYDLMEEYHRTFPPDTMAIAYFENHDSVRASAKWRERFTELLKEDEAAELWKETAGNGAGADVMTALKNLQCSLINTVSGSGSGVNFCCSMENGTDFMETARTDFEHATLLDYSLREKEPNSLLHRAYVKLNRVKNELKPVRGGHVYYLRHNLAPCSGDKVFALVRYDLRSRILFLANLDPAQPRKARFSFSGIPLEPEKRYAMEKVFDTYPEMGLEPLAIPEKLSGRYLSEGLAEFRLNPLQSVVIAF